jgi:hypothetical protein
MGRFNRRKFSDVEVKVKYQAKISNRFSTLENLGCGDDGDDDDVDINRTWGSTRENVNASTTENVGFCRWCVRECSLC